MKAGCILTERKLRIHVCVYEKTTVINYSPFHSPFPLLTPIISKQSNLIANILLLCNYTDIRAKVEGEGNNYLKEGAPCS